MRVEANSGGGGGGHFAQGQVNLTTTAGTKNDLGFTPKRLILVGKGTNNTVFDILIDTDQNVNETAYALYNTPNTWSKATPNNQNVSIVNGGFSYQAANSYFAVTCQFYAWD